MISEKLTTPESRIVYFIEHLKNSGKVRFKEEVFENTGITRQYFTNIKRGDQDKKRFTTTQIQLLCKHYNVNANWIFGVEKEMYRLSE